jgi:hypothetical protein
VTVYVLEVNGISPHQVLLEAHIDNFAHQDAGDAIAAVAAKFPESDASDLAGSPRVAGRSLKIGKYIFMEIYISTTRVKFAVWGFASLLERESQREPERAFKSR